MTIYLIETITQIAEIGVYTNNQYISFMSTAEDKPFTNLAIEKEKTRRLKIKLTFFVLVVVAGIAGILSAVDNGKTGEFKVDITKGEFKFKIDQPIVSQTKMTTNALDAEDQTYNYTTGEVSKDVIENIENETKKIDPYSFTGKNYINPEGGYLFTVENPGNWNLIYNPLGLTNPILPINTVAFSDGTHMNITKEALARKMDIKEYVDLSVETLMSAGIIQEKPEISLDKKSQVAFLMFNNTVTNGVSYMKIILNNNTAFVASANYNTEISNEKTIEDLIAMITSFTLIS